MPSSNGGFDHYAPTGDAEGFLLYALASNNARNTIPVHSMAKELDTTRKKKPIEQYEHTEKQRKNNPPVGLVDAKSDPVEGQENLRLRSI